MMCSLAKVLGNHGNHGIFGSPQPPPPVTQIMTPSGELPLVPNLLMMFLPRNVDKDCVNLSSSYHFLALQCKKSYAP